MRKLQKKHSGQHQNWCIFGDFQAPHKDIDSIPLNMHSVVMERLQKYVDITLWRMHHTLPITGTKILLSLLIAADWGDNCLLTPIFHKNHKIYFLLCTLNSVIDHTVSNMLDCCIPWESLMPLQFNGVSFLLPTLILESLLTNT